MNDVLHILLPDNPLIRATIAALGFGWLAALFVATGMTRRLGRERQKLRQLREKPPTLTNEGTVGAILVATPTSFAERLIKGMIQQRGLASARPSDVLAPLADEVALIPHALRPVSNWLLLGGLIGTVVGLTYTLSGLGPQIQDALAAANPLAVADSLGSTLKEMRGAFAGTFWGVVTALTLQFVSALASGQADRLITELERFAAEISPAIYPAGTEQHLKSLQQMLEEGRRFYEDTQTRVRETSDRFEKVLTEASTLIASSLKTLETTSATIGRSLLGASGEVRQSAERLTQAAKSLDAYQGELKNTYTLFSDMFERSMAHLKAHADSEVQEIRDLQRQFGDAGSHIVAEVFRTMELLHQVGDKLQVGTTSYLQGTEAVHTSLRAGFDALGSNLNQVLGSYTREVGAVSLRLDTLGTQLEASTQASRAVEKTLKSKDDAEYTRHKDQSNTLRALTEAAAHLAGTLTALEPAAAATRELPAQVKTVFGELAAELQQQSAAVVQSVNALGTQQEGAANQLLSEQQALRTQVAEQTRALEQHWSSSLAALQVVAEQSAGRSEWTALTEQLQRLGAGLREMQALLAAQPTALHAEQLIRQQAALHRDFSSVTLASAAMPKPQAADPEEAQTA